jgi:hypothetical protein
MNATTFRLVLGTVALTIGLIVWLSAAMANGRVALVVGVSKYEHAGVLSNTINDANDMTAALKRLGFDVETILNPTRAELEAAIRRYGKRSSGADVGLFHYSGHALDAAGQNWILPSTANINSERDLRFEAIDLNAILEQTDGAARVSIIFLDACRDNPVARRLSGAHRGVSSPGLARLEVSATGTLVAFAAAPGQVALDAVDDRKKNSPFTTAILQHIEIPGLEIKGMMARVTKDVVEATKGKQRPWQNSSLEGEFYFTPLASAAPTASSAAPNVEIVFWDSIKTSRNPADFEAYVARFPKGNFIELARNRLAMLRQEASQKSSKTTNVENIVPVEPASSSTSTRLIERLAALSVAQNVAEGATRGYLDIRGRKAIAVAPKARRTWRSGPWLSERAAEAGTLEGCQLYYAEPCTLVARDDTLVQPEKPPLLRDMARTRYAGRFDPQMIPVSSLALVRRADVLSYRSAVGPKAAAFHPWGFERLFIVATSANQFEAEEQALAQCNNDPTRKGADGPCFLYSVGDRVVLPQRLVHPRPRPQTVSEAFAYMGLFSKYFSVKGHKAIALALESGRTFYWDSQSSAAIAEQKALEGCQLSYVTRCILLASDDTLQAPDPWKADRRDMPRLQYNGQYEPEHVPLFSGAENAALRSYGSLPMPKAMAIRPNGARVRTATGATPVDAQSKALSACNDDADPLPCFVYAVDDRVILTQRRTEPFK